MKSSQTLLTYDLVEYTPPSGSTLVGVVLQSSADDGPDPRNNYDWPFGNELGALIYWHTSNCFAYWGCERFAEFISQGQARIVHRMLGPV